MNQSGPRGLTSSTASSKDEYLTENAVLDINSLIGDPWGDDSQV